MRDDLAGPDSRLALESVRELIVAAGGSLRLMADLMHGPHGSSSRGNRMGAWRLVQFAGLSEFLREERLRAERVLGITTHRKGFGTRGFGFAWDSNHGRRLGLAP